MARGENRDKMRQIFFPPFKSKGQFLCRFLTDHLYILPYPVPYPTQHFLFICITLVFMLSSYADEIRLGHKFR